MVCAGATKTFYWALLMLILSSLPLTYAAEKTASWDTRHKSDPVVLILLEKTIKINKDYSYTESNHRIVNVQTEGGKKWGEVKIRYNNLRQDVSFIEATTITPSGEKIKADRTQDVSQSGDAGVYNDERQKIVSMPQVLPGSTLDIRSVVKTNKPVIDKHFYTYFSLTSPFPTKKVRYVVTAPKDIPLVIAPRNTDMKPVVTESKDDITYTWEMTEPEKIRQEEFMPPAEELNKTITITTLKDWRQLADWSWALFSKNLQSSPEIKMTVQKITENRLTTEDKIQAISEYVQKNMRYVAMHVDSHGYEPHPADRVFALKYGDCKDHSLLGIAMLAEIGIKAWPVLIGGAKEVDRSALLPVPSYFDHAIVHFELNGRKYFLDLLERGYSLKNIPARLAGRQVFIVNDRGGFFDRIPEENKEDVALIEQESITIKPDGQASVSTTISFSNDFSVGIRVLLEKAAPDEREKFLAAIETQSSHGGEILHRAWENIDSPYKPVRLTMNVERSNFAQVMGDMLMFGPQPVIRDALFSAPSREYPIVISAPVYIENKFSYIIPDGFEVINLPKPVILKTSFADYIREFSTDGSKITGREFIEYKSARVAAAEYAKVQAFYNNMTKMTNSKIVIKKNN